MMFVCAASCAAAVPAMRERLAASNRAFIATSLVLRAAGGGQRASLPSHEVSLSPRTAASQENREKAKAGPPPSIRPAHVHPDRPLGEAGPSLREAPPHGLPPDRGRDADAELATSTSRPRPQRSA